MTGITIAVAALLIGAQLHQITQALQANAKANIATAEIVRLRTMLILAKFKIDVKREDWPKFVVDSDE